MKKYTILFLSAALFLVFSLAHGPASAVTQSLSGTSRVIFDLIPRYAPSVTPITILAVEVYNRPFPDPKNPNGYEQNQACNITYTNGMVSKTDIPSDRVVDEFNSAKSNMADWFAPKGTRLCDQATILKFATGTVIVQVPVPGVEGAFYKSLAISKNKLTLVVNSAQQYKVLFKGLFYRDGSMTDWPHHKISSDFEWEPFSKYSKINLLYKGTLRYSAMNTNPVSKGITPPPHAQNTYDPKKHTLHYTIGIPVQWRDPLCKKPDPNNSLCKYHGKIFWFQIELYDARSFSLEGPEPIIKAIPNAVSIYTEPLRSFLPSGATSNPFNTVNNVGTISGDLLPMMTKAVLTFEEKSKQDGIMYIPPRKLIGSRYETDQEYLSHFGFGAVNTGWEAPGLGRASFETNVLTITGVLK